MYNRVTINSAKMSQMVSLLHNKLKGSPFNYFLSFIGHTIVDLTGIMCRKEFKNKLDLRKYLKKKNYIIFCWFSSKDI